MINLLQKMVLALAFTVPSMSSADEITLTSVDQTVILRGEFVGLSADAYIIEYNEHNLYVPIQLMTCEGNNCLEFVPTSQKVSLATGDS
jgi:hypothetical protein